MKVPAPRKLPSGSWFIQLRLGGESIPVTAATAKDCTRERPPSKQNGWQESGYLKSRRSRNRNQR